MKKFQLFFCLAVIFCFQNRLFAVSAGDIAPKIESIKVLNCRAITTNQRVLDKDKKDSKEIVQTLKISDIIASANEISEASSEKNNSEPVEHEYVALIFWATWSPTCRQVFSVLEDLNSLYSDDVLFLLISREAIDKVERFDSIAKLNIPFIIDDQSRTTLDYMGYDQNYPTVFLIEDNNEILWRGDLVDFERVIKNLKADDFDAEKETLLANYQHRLRENIRKGDLNGILSLSQKMFEIDQNSKVACRAILYAFNLITEKQLAIDFVARLIKEYPKSSALRLLLTDISIRQNVSHEKLFTLTKNNIDKFSDNYQFHSDLFWLIFNNFNFANRPLDILALCNQKAYLNINNITNKQLKANTLTSQARLLYLTGKIQKALELQQKASKLYITPSWQQQSISTEKYYQKALKLKL
ncbi:redoxin family protein [Lentisphaerota bacterium WC36G]|nr:redoxin family protein [Lentisphaerae bacterium WC36]